MRSQDNPSKMESVEIWLTRNKQITHLLPFHSQNGVTTIIAFKTLNFATRKLTSHTVDIIVPKSNVIMFENSLKIKSSHFFKINRESEWPCLISKRNLPAFVKVETGEVREVLLLSADQRLNSMHTNANLYSWNDRRHVISLTTIYFSESKENCADSFRRLIHYLLSYGIISATKESFNLSLYNFINSIL